jgi:16S rRNA (guanine527-N7)-methyltransferase
LAEAVAQNIVHWRIDTWFPELGKTTLEQLKKFHDELMKHNKTIELIGVKTIFHADLIHFADSIIACRLIKESNPKLDEIYDFGSGNGFPGVVFALLFPAIKVHLVESDDKKVEYLKQCTTALGLKNVTVHHKTIESLAPNSVKYCMARGLANISKSILMSRRVVAVGGVFYHLKGETWSGEVGEIPTQLCSVWTPGLVGTYKHPVGNFQFAVIKTDKIA